MEEKIFPIPEFPSGYNDNRIILLVRDSHWLYAYWEISEEKKREISLAFGNNTWEKGKLVLKTHQIMPNYRVERSIYIHPMANSWYIHVEHPNCLYQAELGLFLEEKELFVSLATSNEVQTPADSFSSIIDEKWALAGTKVLYEMQKNLLEENIFTGSYSSIQLVQQEEN